MNRLYVTDDSLRNMSKLREEMIGSNQREYVHTD